MVCQNATAVSDERRGSVAGGVAGGVAGDVAGMGWGERFADTAEKVTRHVLQPCEYFAKCAAFFWDWVHPSPPAAVHHLHSGRASLDAPRLRFPVVCGLGDAAGGARGGRVWLAAARSLLKASSTSAAQAGPMPGIRRASSADLRCESGHLEMSQR